MKKPREGIPGMHDGMSALERAPTGKHPSGGQHFSGREQLWSQSEAATTSSSELTATVVWLV